jgi:hypothetical protein
MSIPLRVESLNEFAVAGAVGFPGLVKSRGVVVVAAAAGERRQHRGLVLAVRLPSIAGFDGLEPVVDAGRAATRQRGHR